MVDTVDPLTSQQHYENAHEWANNRKWWGSSLELKIPANKKDRIEHHLSTLVNQAFNAPECELIVEKVTKKYLKVRIISPEKYKDPRVAIWMQCAMKILVEKKDSEAAGVILNQLHGLDIEEFLIEKGENLASQKAFRGAEHCYHALSLMHPFDYDLYIKRARMFESLGNFDKCRAICQEGLLRVTDDKERRCLEITNFKAITQTISSKASVELGLKETQKYIETGLLIFDSKTDAPLPVELITQLSEIFQQYTKIYGYRDQDSYQFLVKNTAKFFALTQRDDPEIVKWNRHWAQQMMELFYVMEINDETMKYAIKNQMQSLAMQFRDSDKIMTPFFYWCWQNDFLADYIDIYENHGHFDEVACPDNYYLARHREYSQSENPKQVELERLASACYEIGRDAQTFYHIGSWYLFKIPADVKKALRFFEKCVELESEDPKESSLLILWACQWLSKDVNGAIQTLMVLNGVNPERAHSCYQLQDKGIETEGEVFKCAGFHRETDDIPLEKPQRFIARSMPTDIDQWIEERKIPLGEGYVGVPVHQIRADKMPKQTKEHYRNELLKKASTMETIQLPLANHDCWIGRHGSPIPRVDIEKYHPAGGTPNFQRFRFQEGSKLTYGGLRLPIRQAIPLRIVQEAYDRWVEEDSSYLVVFNPEHYPNVSDIHSEIYKMDVGNKA